MDLSGSHGFGSADLGSVDPWISVNLSGSRVCGSMNLGG